MNELPQDTTSELEQKHYKSLGKNLVFWLLVLSLIPVIVVSWFSYQQARSSLTNAAKNELELSAVLSVRFIRNWFDYRTMDINSQAGAQIIADMTLSLSEGLNKSGKHITDYVKTYDWVKRVDGYQQDLVIFSRQYDYIYDVLLIDTSGNIIYTVAKEDDLGSNLYDGVYSSSQLAKSFEYTQQTGRVGFSDLERYEPSNNIISAFLTAPVVDENGNKLGVLAVQLRLDRVFNLLNNATSRQKSLHHYIVSESGILLTPLTTDNWLEVLVRNIDTHQFRLWKKEHGDSGNQPDDMVEDSSIYIGPNGNEVIGMHHLVQAGQTKWLLISEVDAESALESANWLARLTVALVLITVLIVGFMALIIARKITKPIIQLADVSMKVADGEENQEVSINADNEIGKLADAFNHMLEKRKTYESVLKETTKNTQEVLADLAEQKYALDQHSIVAITDVKGDITFANQKFSDISGYSIEELIGKNHRILNSGYHDREFFVQMYETIGKGNVWHGEVCNRAKDGHLYWVNTTIVPFKDDKNKPKSYIAIRTDITERKKAEELLIEAKNEALQAVGAKSEFLASMSHEIRTPMNGVLGMLGLLSHTDLNGEQVHRVKIAQSSAQALLNLINDILDFSKVEAGKLDLELLDYNLRGMLGEFSEAMGLQAQAKDLEIILDVKGIEESMVKGDPGRLRQILTNLVGNAIKFTESGEIVIRVEIEEYSENRLQMFCSISDTGIGIPEEKIPGLFDSFSQVDASTTRKYGGTGLGLAIAKKLCLLMQGDITARTTENGSVFEFNVKLDKSQLSQQVVPNVDINKLKLLIVDDNATNLEVLRAQLEHWGASVVEASNAAEALVLCEEYFQKGKSDFFDIAFLDMQMPEMDGKELGIEIKKDKRFDSMKLIMMTSMGFQGDAKGFADIGFSGYFPKPATTSDLFDALSVVAEGGKALQQAKPLVTHDYLQTLSHEEAVADNNWSEDVRILLVEDNQVNQLVAMGILNGFGLQVDVAANGIEALVSLKQSHNDVPYSLVLMDCQMPEMDGYEASIAICEGEAGEMYKTIPIIAMTANAMEGDREKCINAGMSDYLSKPVEPADLFKKLNKWLSIKLQDNTRQTGIKPVVNSKTIVVWDKKDALNRVLNNQDLLNTLIEIFFQETPIRINELQQVIEAGNCEEASKVVHGLKGVAANLSGLLLYELAAEMEAVARQGKPDELIELLPGLNAAVDQLIKCFKKYLNEQDLLAHNELN